MSIPQHLIDRFGGLSKIPAYIRNFYKGRDEARQRKAEAEREAKRKREEERARIKALRRPPARVWRIGQTIFWTPPETVGQLQPAGYWIHEGGSVHGDYVLPDARESQLYGTSPASVEAYYHDTALGEAYISPAVAHVEGEDRFLVGTARYYASQTRKGKSHVNRWRRVLAAFGVTGGRWYDLRRGLMDSEAQPLNPPMTAAEAQRYADKGWKTWDHVARTLRRLEGIPEPTPEAAPSETPAEGPSGPSAQDAAVIATIKGYLKEPKSRRPAVYYDRWTRALAGLGAVDHDKPMAASEAQGYADRGWRRWEPVAAALHRREGQRE